MGSGGGMTALWVLALVVIAVGPPLVVAAWLLHRDSRRHRRVRERLMRCEDCQRFRPLSAVRAVRRPRVVPGRPLWFEPVYVCDPPCERGRGDQEAA